MIVIQRIQKHYDLGTNQDQISALLTMPASTYRDNVKKARDEIHTGKRVHTNAFYGKLIELCEKDNLNPNWVFFGKYPIYNDDKNEVAKIIGQDDLKNYADDNSISIAYYKDMSNIIKNKKDCVYLVLPKDIISGKDIKAVQISDDSMSPNIEKSSLVFVDIKTKKVKDNYVYLVEYKGEVFIKRLELSDEFLLLRSDNKSFKTITAKSDDVKVVGMVMNSIQITV